MCPSSLHSAFIHYVQILMNVPLATPVETERALMWLAALSAAVTKDLSQAQWWIVKVTHPLYFFFLRLLSSPQHLCYFIRHVFHAVITQRKKRFLCFEIHHWREIWIDLSRTSSLSQDFSHYILGHSHKFYTLWIIITLVSEAGTSRHHKSTLKMSTYSKSKIGLS